MSNATFWRSTASAVRIRRDEPFVILDKNFCNYPLARDVRTSAGIKWRKGQQTGDWLAELPGDRRIMLRLPPDVADGRAPSAFDMNVLLLLLSEARRTHTAAIHLQSRSEVLRIMGYGVDADNLRKIEASLEMWSCLTIVHRHWYFAKAKDEEGSGQHGRMRLPPPIISFSLSPEVRINIDDAWLQHQKKFWERIPIPLPRRAAAQNLVLCLLTSIAFDRDPEDEHAVTWKRGVRQLCYKLGLNHTTRNRVLWNAVEEARAWFSGHGGALLHHVQQGEIVFIIRKPKRDAVKESVPRLKLEDRFLAKPSRHYSAYDDDGREYAVTEHADGRVTEVKV